MERFRPAAQRPPPSLGANIRHHTTRCVLFLLLLALGACSNNDAESKGAPTVNTDLTALQRLIKLPADVNRGEWQTGTLSEHGGDWWVAAVLDVSVDQMPLFLVGPATPETLETPLGMLATSLFATLAALPGANSAPNGQLRIAGNLHGVEPYIRSPLLHGQAMRLSPTQVFVMLWTD